MKNKKVIILFCVLVCCVLAMTLVACNPKPTYTVTFDVQGGSAVASQSVKEGKTITTPSTPTKDGYTFTGWYTDVANTQAFNTASAITSDVTLYAGWKITPYAVTFDAQGGSAVNGVELEPGTSLVLPQAPTRLDYTFTGWYTDAAATQAFDATLAITSDITLYAGWQIIRYTVTYYNEDGNTYDTVIVDSGSTAQPTNVPSKVGYAFTGWYTDLSGGTVVPDTTLIRSDKSLFARFAINQYTVSCQKSIAAAGTVSDTQTYDYGTSVTVTATTSTLEYVFGGWYENDTLVSSALSYTFTLSNFDVTLTASWSVRPGLADYTYTATANTLTIKKYNGSATAVSVPYGVTHIGNEAFYYLSNNNTNCMYITSITLPNTVISIGSSSFKSCSALLSISLSNSLTSIGASAFEFCKKLESINIPRGVTSIADYTFYSCGKLASVTIPDTVASLGKSVFYSCASLTSIIIPNSVSTVGKKAFDMCSNTTINCVAAAKPAGWDDDWKYLSGSVVWGYTA